MGNDLLITADFVGNVTATEVKRVYEFFWKGELSTRGFYSIMFKQCEDGVQAQYRGEPYIGAREQFEKACKAALNFLSHTKGVKPWVFDCGNIHKNFFDYGRV